jgi:septin family protein
MIPKKTMTNNLMSSRTHMQDLKDVTQDIHYENYRSARIANGGDLSPTLDT